MTSHILLDTGVLGLITHPSDKPEPLQCKEWLQDVLQAGHSVYVPEIADYEHGGSYYILIFARQSTVSTC